FIYSLNKVTITGSEGIKMSPIGFKNYIDILTSDLDFVDFLSEFLGQVVLYVPIILIISMVIAILLNQKIKLRGFFRSIFFLPVIIASGPVINELLKQGAGTIPMLEESGIVEMLNNALPAFLSNPIAMLFDEMIIVLWFSGVQIVLFLAGLQKISGEIYEAAQIDGASPWESFWKITLPSLKSIIMVSSVYTIVMLATFSNNSIIKYIQKVMFDTSKSYGYSSALAWIYFILIALLLGLVSLLLRNKKEFKVKKKKKGLI
ncbi:MAG TPA: sugar ABC transporter permease, partial [Acholeplasma sp.]|nr:sugar ABC transporter permease [Acholeplasma sp.]